MDEDHYVPNDVDNGPAQRKALVAFANAIGARTKLGEDEAGNPRLEGRQGRVYVQPGTAARKAPTYQIFCFDSKQRLKFTKETLARFMKLTNPGDEDCMFALVGPPRSAFAEIIRDRLVIHKRRAVSEPSAAQLAARAAFAARQRSPAVQAAE